MELTPLQWITLVWTLAALVGLVLHIIRISAAMADKRYAARRGLNGWRKRDAWATLRAEGKDATEAAIFLLWGTLYLLRLLNGWWFGIGLLVIHVMHITVTAWGLWDRQAAVRDAKHEIETRGD